MTIKEIREIMLSEEFPDNEKLDRLHALIPPDVFKIDSLNQAKPAPKQLNLKSLVLRTLAKERGFALLLGKQAGSKAVAVRRSHRDPQKRIVFGVWRRNQLFKLFVYR